LGALLALWAKFVRRAYPGEFYNEGVAALTQDGILMELSLAGFSLPVTLRFSAPLSDADLLTFSRRNQPYRIERNAKGELEIMTPLGGDGSRWEALVIRELVFWAEDYGGVSFSSNGGFSLPDGSMLSPDAAWVAEERWNALTREERRSFPPLCPDFLIEILSANDSLPALQAKMQIWMANGAKLAWRLIDPYVATVRIYRPGREVELLDRPDSLEADGPVAGFRLTTAKLWDKE